MDYENLQLQITALQNQINNLPIQNKQKFSNTTINTTETVVQRGGIQSAEFSTGATGWRFDADGNLEANSGHFRGDVTGASGTFSGVLTGGSLNIPDITSAPSFHVDNTGNIWSGAAAYNIATNPFAVSSAGLLRATAGTIGGFTITATELYGGIIKTAATVAAGSSGVIMDTAGLRGYDSVLGQTFNLPTNGSAPTFTSGIINSTIFNINTNAVLRTSATVGDGSADSAGILINNTGLYGCQASQTLANANIKVLVDGTISITGAINATSGNITGSLVVGTSGLIRSGQTAYDTGTGFWLGNDGGTPKFSIGASGGPKLTWNGTVLKYSGIASFYNPSTNGSDSMFYTDDIDRIPGYRNIFKAITLTGGPGRYQSKVITDDWADAERIESAVLLGSFLYLLLLDEGTTPNTYRIYRYAKDDLASGGTEMTFSGTAPDLTVDVVLRLGCDGTNFYINYQGGNSANAYVLTKYSVSGTVFTHISNITCGSATLGFDGTFAVLSSGNIYTAKSGLISKFNSSGTLQYTETAAFSGNMDQGQLFTVEDVIYANVINQRIFSKLYYTN